MGWIYQRGSRWYFQWYEKRGNKRVTRKRSMGKGIRTKAQAKRVAEQWELELAAREHGIELPEMASARSRQAIMLRCPLEDVAPSFIRHEKARFARSHAKDVERIVQNKILPAFGDRRSITQAEVSEWLTEHRETLTGQTCNKLLTVWKKLFAYAIAAGYAENDINPADTLKRFSTKDSRERPAVTLEQYYRLRDAASDDAREIIVALFRTGMRTGELFNLRWEDVDLDNNRIHIRPRQDWSPKSGKAGAVAIHGELRDILIAKPETTGYVFPNPHTGGPRDNFRKAFKRARDYAGLPGDVTPHSLRHGLAHELGRRVNAQIVQQALRHSDIRTTMRYMHEHPEETAAAVLEIP